MKLDTRQPYGWIAKAYERDTKQEAAMSSHHRIYGLGVGFSSLTYVRARDFLSFHPTAVSVVILSVVGGFETTVRPPMLANCRLSISIDKL